MTLFFASILFVLASLIGTFSLFPQIASAATDCGWVSDRAIRCTDDNNVTTNLVDSNPNDANRTFKSTSVPTWCKVAGVVDTIVIGSSPASATFFDMVTPEPIVGDVGDVITPDKVPKVDCAVKNATIALSGVSAATKPSTNCENRPGGSQQACINDLADGNAAFAQGCSGPYPSTTGLCNPTAAPGYTQPANATGNPTANAEGKEPDPCDSLGNDFSLRWIACPILTAGTGMADGLDGLIEENLHYDTNIFNEDTGQGKGFKAAWGAFRSIALALVLIAGLVMIVSQGTGMGIVDAYTIRKVLPRLLVAVIGITLSWELLAFIITFFNDMGHWIQDLILLPFQAAAGGGNSGNAFASVAGALTAAVIGTGATAAYLIAIGPLGILSLIGTVVLALLVGWLVLVVRSVVITVIILFAPLAFACYILPNTKKVWDFWQNALITMLMVFPIIMALLAAGKALSIVSDNGLMKVIFLIAPYFFIPFAFKLAGGLMSTVFSMVNDKGRGGFDRLRNTRANQRKQRFEDAVAGRGNNWVSRSGMGNVARRAQLANQGGFNVFTKSGRATYAQARSKLLNETAHKALEGDHSRWAGDDTAMGLALKPSTTRQSFLADYAKQYKEFQEKNNPGVVVSEKEASQAAYNALGGIESGLGAKLGSEAMMAAAFKAKTGSNTGYASGDWNSIAVDAAPLMSNGILTQADVMSAIKSNKNRTEFSGVGSSMIMRTMANVQRDYEANPTSKTLITDAHRDKMFEDALTGAEPGQLVAARHESVAAFAPAMLNEVKTSYQEGGEEFMRTLASMQARYQIIGQTSKQKAKHLGDGVISKTIDENLRNADGSAMTVRDAMERYKNDPQYLNYKQEFITQYSAQASAATQQAANAAQGNPGQIPQIPGR